MKPEKILGIRVHEQRKKMRLLQKELGEMVGLSGKAISTIENGLRGTSFETLVQFAYIFHVSTDYLLGITDNPAWRGGRKKEYAPLGEVDKEEEI